MSGGNGGSNGASTWIQDERDPRLRRWEEFYRNRWQHDKVVRSTHGVNCTGSCTWNIHVKDGIVTWEMQALDYPAYNLYGISYGTRLATVVMRLVEESADAAAMPTIRSVVIDGVMPTTLNQAGENPVSEQLVALRVFADCEADAACGAAAAS